MCPGQVPGSRSDTVSERSTTLAPASDAKSNAPPSKSFEISFGIEAQDFGISYYLDLCVPERLVEKVLGDVEVLEVQRVRNADEARLFGRNSPVAADGRPERLLVGREDHGHLRPLDESTRDDVSVHGLAFDLTGQPPRGQVGETNSQGVAVRLLADVADDQVLDRGFLRLIDAEDAEASDHVRIHPRPRVVLAQRVDVEHVDIRDGESGHHLHVLAEELHLALVDPIRGYSLDDRRLVVGVLD